MSDGEWLKDYPWYAPQTIPVVDDVGNVSYVLRMDPNVNLVALDKPLEPRTEY